MKNAISRFMSEGRKGWQQSGETAENTEGENEEEEEEEE